MIRKYFSNSDLEQVFRLEVFFYAVAPRVVKNQEVDHLIRLKAEIVK